MYVIIFVSMVMPVHCLIMPVVLGFAAAKAKQLTYIRKNTSAAWVNEVSPSISGAGGRGGGGGSWEATPCGMGFKPGYHRSSCLWSMWFDAFSMSGDAFVSAFVICLGHVCGHVEALWASTVF